MYTYTVIVPASAGFGFTPFVGLALCLCLCSFESCLSVFFSLLENVLVFFFGHLDHRDAGYAIEHGYKRVDPVQYSERNICAIDLQE